MFCTAVCRQLSVVGGGTTTSARFRGGGIEQMCRAGPRLGLAGTSGLYGWLLQADTWCRKPLPGHSVSICSLAWRMQTALGFITAGSSQLVSPFTPSNVRLLLEEQSKSKEWNEWSDNTVKMPSHSVWQHCLQEGDSTEEWQLSKLASV